jgi:hypothetical protein
LAYLLDLLAYLLDLLAYLLAYLLDLLAYLLKNFLQSYKTPVKIPYGGALGVACNLIGKVNEKSRNQSYNGRAHGRGNINRAFRSRACICRACNA